MRGADVVGAVVCVCVVWVVPRVILAASSWNPSLSLGILVCLPTAFAPAELLHLQHGGGLAWLKINITMY